MNRYGILATALIGGLLIEELADITRNGMDNGYDADFKAEEYGSIRFTHPDSRKEVEQKDDN